MKQYDFVLEPDKQVMTLSLNGVNDYQYKLLNKNTGLITVKYKDIPEITIEKFPTSDNGEIFDVASWDIFIRTDTYGAYFGDDGDKEQPNNLVVEFEKQISDFCFKLNNQYSNMFSFSVKYLKKGNLDYDYGFFYRLVATLTPIGAEEKAYKAFLKSFSLFDEGNISIFLKNPEAEIPNWQTNTGIVEKLPIISGCYLVNIVKDNPIKKAKK